jgi:cytochrome P450
VPARLPRVAHDPLVYKDWHIPARAIVSQSTWIANHDAAVFPQPFAFRPDRWIEAQGQLDKYLASFTKGTRNCAGINLAWAELRLALAYVVDRFDMRLFDTIEERDVLLDRDQFFGTTRKDSKGIRVVVEGRRT